jgi:peptidoglycan-associated lipoprotein
MASADTPAASGETIAIGGRHDFAENVGDKVFFAYDRYDLDRAAVDTLLRQAAWLTQFPTAMLLIEGHADERGTREYNLALAARRASAVRDYLASFGVAAYRLETVSYGKERPQCFEQSESCWAQNRRSVSTLRNAANF